MSVLSEPLGISDTALQQYADQLRKGGHTFETYQ